MSWMVSWDRTLCVLELVTQSCPALCDSMDCSSLDSSVHGDSPGKNTGVGCHALFQGIFPIRGSNLRLGNCRQSLYRLNHQGSPPNTLSVQVSYQSCLTLCNPMNCSMPGFPDHHQLPEIIQTHVHRVGDAIQLSHPLSFPSSPVFCLSQNQGLFQ